MCLLSALSPAEAPRLRVALGRVAPRRTRASKARSPASAPATLCCTPQASHDPTTTDSIWLSPVRVAALRPVPRRRGAGARTSQWDGAPICSWRRCQTSSCAPCARKCSVTLCHASSVMRSA
eukprot:6200643-Pleurochrysis_carterae.AAC.4